MKPKRHSSSSSAIIPGALFVAMTSAALAADASWVGGTEGTNNYTVNSNWSTNAFPGISGTGGNAGTSTDIATFSSNTSSPVSYTAGTTSDVNLGGITFSGTPGPVTFQSGTGGGTRRIYFTAGGAGITMESSVTSPMTFARTGISSGASGNLTYTNNAAASDAILNMSSTFLSLAPADSTLILGGTNTGLNRIGNSISNTGGGALSVVKNGPGTWLLDGSNSHSGTTTVNDGVLGLGSSNALSTGALILNGGTLGSAGASARTLTNNVTVGGDFSLGGVAAQPITLNGTIDLGTSIRTVNLINSATFGGVVSNGGLTLTAVAGARTLTLNAVSTYSGPTVVSAGTLLINGSLANSTSVSAGAGATVGGNGAVANALNVDAGAFVQPGATVAAVGTLATGMLTMSGTYLATITGNGVNDRLNVTGTADFSGGTIAPVLSGYIPALNDTFDLADWTASFSGSPSFDFASAALQDGLEWDTSSFATDGSLRVVNVPEPGVAMLGSLALAGLLRRRR